MALALLYARSSSLALVAPLFLLERVHVFQTDANKLRGGTTSVLPSPYQLLCVSFTPAPVQLWTREVSSSLSASLTNLVPPLPPQSYLSSGFCVALRSRTYSLPCGAEGNETTDGR